MLNALLALATRLSGAVNAIQQYDEGLAYQRAGEFKRAVPLLREAAQVGHIDAAAVYGSMLLLGQGVPENGPEGQRWLEQAVEADKMDAKSLLGMALATGKAGVKRDLPRAVALLTECAANEDAKAAEMLEMIQTGKGMFKRPRR